MSTAWTIVSSPAYPPIFEEKPTPKSCHREGQATLKREDTKVARSSRAFADCGDPLPGFFEIDMVEHYNGPKTDGDYLHTLVLTDIASGWTEMRRDASSQSGAGD